MTQEEMQKAASDSVHDTIGFVINEFDINFEENNYEAGRRDALIDYGSVLFTDGAKWRINSVWHDPEEIPDIVKLLLVEHEDGHCGMSILYTKKASREGWKRWAYVKDLLPIKDDEK